MEEPVMKKLSLCLLIALLSVFSLFAETQEYINGYNQGYADALAGLNNKFETTLDPEDFGNWSISYYVDSFGDATDIMYICNSNYQKSTFKQHGSTYTLYWYIMTDTMTSPLRIAVSLHEISTSSVATGTKDEPVEYEISIKTNDGTILSMTGKNTSDRVFIDEEYCLDFLELLLDEKSFKMTMTNNDYSPATYNLGTVDCAGFANAFCYAYPEFSIEEAQEILVSKGEIAPKDIEEYDSTGNLSYAKYFNEDGSWYETKYNNGILVYEKDYYNDSYWFEYQYDNEGIMISESYCYAENYRGRNEYGTYGIPTYTYELYYGDIHEYWYDEDYNTICEKVTDEDGFVREVHYDSDGNVLSYYDSTIGQEVTFSSDFSKYSGTYSPSEEALVTLFAKEIGEYEEDLPLFFNLTLCDGGEALFIEEGDEYNLMYTVDETGKTLVLYDEYNSLTCFIENNFLILPMYPDVYLEKCEDSYMFTPNAIVKTFVSMMEQEELSLDEIFSLTIEEDGYTEAVVEGDEGEAYMYIDSLGNIYTEDMEKVGYFADDCHLIFEYDGISLKLEKQN